jgi:acyl carrier protein
VCARLEAVVPTLIRLHLSALPAVGFFLGVSVVSVGAYRTTFTAMEACHAAAERDGATDHRDRRRPFKQQFETFDRDARFREDFGRDSLDLFELLFTLEEELGISIPDADAIQLRTLTDVLEYLDRHMEVGRLDAPVR